MGHMIDGCTMSCMHGGTPITMSPMSTSSTSVDSTTAMNNMTSDSTTTAAAATDSTTMMRPVNGTCCACTSCYSGQYCTKFDPCCTVRCLNGGSPIASNNICQCQCTSQFQGTFCQLSIPS